MAAPATPSTPSKATRSSSSLAEKLQRSNSPLMKMGSEAVEVLDETAEKVGQPRGVIVAAVIALQPPRAPLSRACLARPGK